MLVFNLYINLQDFYLASPKRFRTHWPMIKLNASNLLLESEEFLTVEKESALGLAAAEDGQGESISKVDSEDGDRSKVLSYYISSQHLAEWLQGLFKGDKHKKSISKYAYEVSLKNIVAVNCVIDFKLYQEYH